MKQLTSEQLLEINNEFKSKYVEWDDLEWDYNEIEESIARYNSEEFEFEVGDLFIRADVSVFYENSRIDIQVSELSEVYYKAEEVSVTEKQAGLILYKCAEYLKEKF